MSAKLIVTVTAALLAASVFTGCTPITAYSTSTGHGSASPVHREHSSTGETYTCMDVRAAQDSATVEEAFAMAERVGFIPSRVETSVSVRDSVATSCRLDDERESAGESRAFTTREGCERLLGPDGIPADAETTTSSTEAATVDPMFARAMLPIIQMRMALATFMADAQRYCQDREMSTALIAGGALTPEFALFAPMTAAFMSTAGGVGGLGLPGLSNGMLGMGTAGGLGLGSTAGGVALAAVPGRGDLVLNSYGMRADAIATVTLNGMPIQLRSGITDRHYVGGVSTIWSVDCFLLRGGSPIPLTDRHVEGQWGIDGGRLDLHAICGRD